MFSNKKLFTSTFWSGCEVVSQQFVQIIISIILARILSPSDFGIFATISIFIYTFPTLIEGGFTGAIVQKIDVNNSDKSTFFWYGIVISFLVILILWFLAPSISAFFDQPKLINIIRFISIGFLFTSLSNVHFAILLKELRFKERFISGLVSIIVSSILALYLAFNGFGVWALVIQNISFNLTKTITLYFIYPWFPKFIFNIKSFIEMFSYGKNLMLAMIVRNIFGNIHEIVIGKFYSAMNLGFYDRGKKFARIAYEMPTTIISRTLFPAISSIQEDKKDVIRIFKSFFSLSLILIWPLLIILITSSEHFIRIILGEKWLQTSDYLEILCIIGMLFPIHILCYTLYNALGFSKLSLKTEILKYTLSIIAICLTYKYGIKFLLFGELIASFIAVSIMLFYAFKLLNLKFINLIFWIKNPLIGSAVIFYILRCLNLNNYLIITLIYKIIIGIFVYLIILFICKDFYLKEFLKKIKNYD